jgi:hypothetical protein
MGNELRLSCLWTKERVGLVGNLYGKRREVKKKEEDRGQMADDRYKKTERKERGTLRAKPGKRGKLDRWGFRF